jgi:hypothetical protein
LFFIITTGNYNDMNPRCASPEFAVTHVSADELLADAGTFMRETGATQRMTVHCLIIVLRRLLPAKGFLVGGLRSDGPRVIRFRAVLPERLVRRDKFHQHGDRRSGQPGTWA